MPQDNLKSLASLLKVFDTSKIVSPEDITAVLSGVLKLLNSFKQQNEALNADTKAAVDTAIAQITAQHDDFLAKVDKQAVDIKSQVTAQVSQQFQGVLSQARALVDEAKAAMPEDGQDADPAAVVPLVLEQIKLPENKPYLLTGEDILSALDQLPEDVGIDASRIKNLPRQAPLVAFGGSTSRIVTVKHGGTTISKLLRSVNFAGSGVTATSDQGGNITVTISGGAAANESNGETLIDSGDHTSFTFAHAPTAVRAVWRKESGQMLTPTTDYTFSSSTLTATSAQVDGNGQPYTLVASYAY